MMPVLFSLLLSLRRFFQGRAKLQAEMLALRHQLLILQRGNRNHRLGLTATDRTLWVWLSRFWPNWRSALLIVKPETVIAWHRKGFRLYWTWKSRFPNGRLVLPEKPELQCFKRWGGSSTLFNHLASKKKVTQITMAQ